MVTTAFDQHRFDDAYPPGIQRSWWHVARNRVIAHTFERHLPRDACVLEVGCGTGIVTAALRENGWNVSGVERGGPRPSPHVSEHLMLGTDALSIPPGRRACFDTLALFDVIEHVADAPAFLRALLGAYPNVRQVVITVPAGADLWSTFDDHYGHYRRYDHQLLHDELTAAGLAPEHSACFFHGLYPVIFLNNLVRRRKRDIRFRAPAPGFSTCLHKALGICFAFESRVLPDRWPGTSIIAVARRR